MPTKKNHTFTHLNTKHQPHMVDVSAKQKTARFAHARALLRLPKEIVQALHTSTKHKTKHPQVPKGPLFETAILAGIMGTKKTADLIPLCHPIMLDKIAIDIFFKEKNLLSIDVHVYCEAKTGVEMEALTGASVAALTVYDMCKAFSQNIVIENIQLIEKHGGKTIFKRSA